MSDPRVERADTYQIVTDQIIAMLEAGTVPWRKPWNPELGMPRSLTTGKPYRGINPLLLHMSALATDFTSPYWGTYHAIQEHGGQVRKGEHGTGIVFWKTYTADQGTEDEHTAFALRWYKVFNASQADGLNLPPVEMPQNPNERIAACDAAIADYLHTGPRMMHGGSRAYYSPRTDTIGMPNLSAFESAEEYYGTAFHELTHSTGHADRLARPDLLEGHYFGDESYSKEELVAEMGAAFLAGQTGIAGVTLPNSASYLASWLRILKGDHKLVVQAAGQAQRAADLILGVTLDIQGNPKVKEAPPIVQTTADGVPAGSDRPAAAPIPTRQVAAETREGLA